MIDFSHPISLWDHFMVAMDRNFQTFRMTSPVISGQYIQLGPGHKHISGSSVDTYNWENLDYPEWDADKDALPHDDRSIDGICCYHSMDHFAKPIRVLAEIQRVLKPGGWFVNIVPHYASELAHTDVTHKSQFGIDTWRNIFSTRHYDHAAVSGNAAEWHLEIGFNMIMGLTERNTVLVTQLFKRSDYLLGYADDGSEVRHIDPPPLSQMKTST